MASKNFDTKSSFDFDTEQPLECLVNSYSATSIFRTIGFIGDSLSSGEFQIEKGDGTSSYHDMFEYSWGQYIARNNGLKAYNFSRGGMTAKWYMESYADEMDFWNKDKACQAYVIALGVNDLLNQDIELGSVADLKPDYRDNAKTFAGYYGQIISRYKEISPDAKFFFVTFPDETWEKAKKFAPKMRELLYDLTKYFDNSYVIDIYKYGPLYDSEFHKKYFLSAHMSPVGYIFTARMIDSYIDYIIRHNPDDFKWVGFINSGIEFK